MTPDEVLAIRYIDWDWWLEVSDRTREPREAARRIRAKGVPVSTAEWHEPIAARLQSPRPPRELIAVAHPDDMRPVLLEGHVRMTAYALYPEYLPSELEVCLGTSRSIDRWTNY